jgi:predicted RNA-binding protein with PUA-like domain
MQGFLFTTTDPQGRSVSLTDECYSFHILTEHPDISNVDEIERAIASPDYIALDAIDDNRLVYYRTYQRRPQRWFTKVVVEENEVITAYRVKRLKQGETILWQR